MQSAFRHLELLEYFLDNPYQETHLRELSRKTGLNVFTTKKTLDDMVQEKLVTESRTGNLRVFKANTDDEFYRLIKVAFTVRKLRDSGVVEHLVTVTPAAASVTLYGSAAKGLDSPESDVDLLVIGQRPAELDLSTYEAALNRRIEVTCMKWSDWVEASRENKAFYTEVITSGVMLYGELPVVE